MTDRQKKRGRRKYKYLNILRTEKGFSDEIKKTFFIVFEKLSFGEKQKFDKKNSGHML